MGNFFLFDISLFFVVELFCYGLEVMDSEVSDYLMMVIDF